MEIDCLVCGQIIKVPEYVDLDNYDGQLSCRHCNTLFHVILVGSKVRKYEILEKTNGASIKDAVSIGSEREVEMQGGQTAKADVEKIAIYNPLRDYLETYVANTMQLTFDQIEGIIGKKLETGAYTLKSWWENDNSNPQAISWLEAGWRILDINFPQRRITLIRASGQD